MIKEIAFTVYRVSDMERARSFYEQKLGLILSSNFENAWVEYNVGTGTFALTTMDVGNQTGVAGAMIAFEVDDFDVTMQQLRSSGVQILQDPVDTSVCMLSTISDPDGNRIIIHRRHMVSLGSPE